MRDSDVLLLVAGIIALIVIGVVLFFVFGGQQLVCPITPVCPTCPACPNPPPPPPTYTTLANHSFSLTPSIRSLGSMTGITDVSACQAACDNLADCACYSSYAQLGGAAGVMQCNLWGDGSPTLNTQTGTTLAAKAGTAFQKVLQSQYR